MQQPQTMQPKTILAVVNNEAELDRVLARAGALADAFGAYLIVAHGGAVPLPAASPMGFPDTGLIEASIEGAREQADNLKAAVDRSADRSGRAVEWRSFLGFTGDAQRQLAGLARATDLIVVQQADPEGPVQAAGGDTLLFETGRPILFVPYTGPYAGIANGTFRRAVVAWNGTAEAARAAFDALPLLAGAESVSILCVDPQAGAGEAPEFAAAEIAEALARHGIKVTVVNEPSGGVPPGTVIENYLAETSADLLVMGAYSQSWLKQVFFGGATKTLLSSMPVATLMSR